MEEEQRKLVEGLKELLGEFENLKGEYHSIDREYISLLRRMEKLALKISDETLRELEDEELENTIRALRLKSTWQTFHSFRI
ncbi:hypothetical protein [Candidatus Pyrohabitans sp.]